MALRFKDMQDRRNSWLVNCGKSSWHKRGSREIETHKGTENGEISNRKEM